MIRVVICWAFIALFIVGGLASITRIGKPRKPMTNGDVLAIVITDALMVLAMAYLLLGVA